MGDLMTEKTISVYKEFIPKIIEGSKTLICKLKKEGDKTHVVFDKGIDAVFPKSQVKRWIPKTKFKVGEVYSICVNDELVWYCPKFVNGMMGEPIVDKDCSVCHVDRKGKEVIGFQCAKSLRIKVLSIREQKLLDITKDDVKKEGYKYDYPLYPKSHFVADFLNIYDNKIPKNIKNQDFNGKVDFIEIAREWNPYTWVLEFKVI